MSWSGWTRLGIYSLVKCKGCGGDVDADRAWSTANGIYCDPACVPEEEE